MSLNSGKRWLTFDCYDTLVRYTESKFAAMTDLISAKGGTKDLVKSGGEWISSVDLENHIVGVEGVAQACVVAQPHPKWDERPVALVILDAGKEVSEQTILEYCETAFAKWQLPDEVLFVDAIPLTSTGKMDKKVVRADLESKGYQLPSLRSESAG